MRDSAAAETILEAAENERRGDGIALEHGPGAAVKEALTGELTNQALAPVTITDRSSELVRTVGIDRQVSVDYVVEFQTPCPG